MKLSRLVSTVPRAFRRVVRLIARPARPRRAEDGTVVQPYRGYGSTRELYLMGRIFHQFQFGSTLSRGLGRDLVSVLRRFLRWGVGDATIVARFGEAEKTIRTDPDGYFHLHLELDTPPPSDRLWHEVDLEVVEPEEEQAHARAEAFVPPASARRVVISDIDDTVMYTGVANKLKMFWRLFARGADSRVAFPGVASLYRALHRGPSGEEENPMLYVSRGPWSIYELLDEFFDLHEIPVGPVLFLREWGLTPQRPLPRRSEDHKLDLVRDMMALYDDRPFILIGDSGQHDPELYAQIVREHPNRVEAIYIRNVSRSGDRARAIAELAGESRAAGTDLVLATDSFAMAEHAEESGFISRTGLAEVLRERNEQADKAELGETGVAVPRD